MSVKLDTLMSVCTEFNNMGCSVIEQMEEVWAANADYPGEEHEDEFRDVVSEKNVNAMDIVVETLHRISYLVGNEDDELDDEICALYTRIQDALDDIAEKDKTEAETDAD